MTSSIEQSPQRYARTGGVLYLAIIVLGLFGEVFVRGTLVVSGDATATASAIAASESSWRAGLAGDLLMHVFDVPVIVVLYLLLRPVSEALALLATFFNLIQTAVLVANKLNLLAPILLVGNAGGLNAFPGAAARAVLIWLSRRMGMASASGYFPRVLGLLMALAGFCYLGNSFALLLAPALAAALFPFVLMPAFVGDLCFALWLTFKGVNLEKWPR